MNDPNFKILFFTDSYPYSSAAEDTFIEPELPHLMTAFSSISLIPKSSEGEKKDVSNGIYVDLSLAQLLMSNCFIAYLVHNTLLSVTSKIFYREILKKPKKTLHPVSIVRLILFLGTAIQTKKWVEKYIISNNIDFSKTIFYTYWNYGTTMGICFAKEIYPEMIVISRAHAADLYEEQHNPHYIPFRPEIFKSINKVFADSENGKKYLLTQYPEGDSIIRLSQMGVNVQDFITASSNDGIFRIVSCSYFVTFKRIDLLILGLCELGKMRKNQVFEWVHIGDGPLRSELEKVANETLPKNIRHSFLGILPNPDLIEYYKNNKIDVFINVSASEGTPVSIMEAQSCSIPVIATSVGGNTEIVTNENGFLLNESPTPLEIANAICTFLDNPSITMQKKEISRQNWNEKYNSEKNFQCFVQDLVELLNNRKKGIM
ncbi:MAG: glycosyltransferase [Methanoregula sp.]